MKTLAPILVCLGFCAPVFAGDEVLKTNKALESYNTKYLVESKNKAFAQSPDGPWAWKGDRITEQDAIEAALAACNGYLKKGQKPCKIVNVNSRWVE